MKSAPLALVHITVLASLLSGCAGAGGSLNSVLTEKTKRTEYYRIFEFKSDAKVGEVIAGASKGLSRNTTNIEESRPIPKGGPLPATPGRFVVTDLLANADPRLSAFAALAGGGAAAEFKRASCDGAVWVAQAVRGDGRDSRVSLSTCIWAYADGYHLDIYANFTKKEGGLFEISRSAAAALIGTPEQWTETTFNDIVRGIVEKTGATPVYLEGFPDSVGESGAATSSAAPYTNPKQP